MAKDKIKITTDEETQIIKESLKQRQICLREIHELEKKYQMCSDEFLEKFEKGELGDD